MKYNSIISAILKYVKDINFPKDNHIKTVGPYINFYCAEILYKSYIQMS